jgi:poly-gamma-glutamate synthesis protein (capsule biosynthesis protein)
MDWGVEGLADTIDALQANELEVVGAGDNLSTALKPIILTPAGMRIAVLAFNSILPMGFSAQLDRAGCAPVGAFTHYEQIEHDQPGTPSRVHTFANREDLARLIEAIQRTKAGADAVILSIHWGIHFVPSVIAAYQREIAHAAIDAGADVVIGHHPHIIKGVEVYRGKVIFYSLGNFAIDPPTAFDNTLRDSRRHKEIVALNSDWEDDGQHTVLRDSALAIVARCLFENGTLQGISALPVHINRDSQPQFLCADDIRFGQVADYLSKATKDAGLNGAITVDSDLLIILVTN